MSSSPRRCAVRLLLTTGVCAGLLLPAAGASAEEPDGATVVGELVQAYPEQAYPEQADPSAEHGSDAPLSWIRTEAGDTVRVATDDLPDVPAGSTVAVTVGDRVPDEAGSDGYEPAHEVLGTDVLETSQAVEAPPAESLTNQVTVALVAPAGGERDGVTLRQVVDAVNGPVARFWSEQTSGAIRLGVTAQHDWLTTRAGCDEPNALWKEVARAVGFVPGPGQHLVVYLSSRPADLPGCSYALGQVGSGPASGGSVYVRDVLPSLIAHELGHTFGLGHSSGLQCDGTVETGNCRTAGYRDYYDVMGASWSQLGALTAAQADRLGALPTAARVDAVAGGPDDTYALAPLAGRSGVRAIRLVASDGSIYWLEYRAPSGRDAWLATSANRFRLDSGVLLHRAGGFPDTSVLLDATPVSTPGWDADLQAALPVGTPVSLGGGFAVTVQAVTGAAATVAVATRPPDGSASAPAPATVPIGGVLPGRSMSDHQAPGVVGSEPEATTSAPGTPAAAPGTPAATVRRDVDPAAASHTTDPGSRSPLVLTAWSAGAAAGLPLLWRLAIRRRARAAAR